METTQENALVIQIEQNGLSAETTKSLKECFMPFYEKAEEWKSKAESLVVTDVSQTKEMGEARTARLALKEIRVNVEKKRKELKEDSLKKGQAIDKVAGMLKSLIEPIETHLENQEKFAEKKETERKANLKAERLEKILPYSGDMPLSDLGEMGEQQFSALYEGLKLAHENRIAEAKKEEERKMLQEQRKAKEDYRYRKMAELGLQWNGAEFIFRDINFHWTDLVCMEDAEFEKYFAQAKERKAKIEQKDADEKEALRLDAIKKQKELDDERKANEEKLKKEREESAERERKLKEEQEAKLKEERAAKAKLEAELKAKQKLEQEEKDKIEAEAKAKILAEKKAAKAPDKDKLLRFAGALLRLHCEELKTQDANAILVRAQTELKKLSQTIIKSANEL